MATIWWQTLLSGENRMIRLQRNTLERLRADRAQQTAILDAVQAIHLQSGSMLRLLKQIGSTMATQADLDALNARLDAAQTAREAAVANIRSDIAALKSANPGLDTTALEATVARVEAGTVDETELDSENPAPPAG
jgi:multidrug resistance efflux pump